MNELEEILKDYERTLFAISEDEDSGELSIEEARECRVQARDGKVEPVETGSRGVVNGIRTQH